MALRDRVSITILSNVKTGIMKFRSYVFELFRDLKNLLISRICKFCFIYYYLSY